MVVISGYAALLALVYCALSVRTLRLRRRLKIAIGDGADQRMLRAMRVHANFAEYVPIGLLIILLVELETRQSLLVHGLGALLLAGRLIHAFGVSRLKERYGFRVTGMAMTFTVLITGSVILLYGLTLG